MGVPLAIISGVALAGYVRHVYRKITRWVTLARSFLSESSHLVSIRNRYSFCARVSPAWLAAVEISRHVPTHMRFSNSKTHLLKGELQWKKYTYALSRFVLAALSGDISEFNPLGFLAIFFNGALSSKLTGKCAAHKDSLKRLNLKLFK